MIDIIIICFSDREFNNTFLIMNFHNTQLIQISVLINIFCKKKKKNRTDYLRIINTLLNTHKKIIKNLRIPFIKFIF